MALATTMKRLGGRGAHVGIVAAFTLFTAFPFYWMVITTFKQTSDLMNRASNPFPVPVSP